MAPLNYLNVGCGDKFHSSWTNIDMRSNSPHVKAHDLRNGIPFPENTFDVIYHSQVLEHFQPSQASFFIRECFRTLRPGGILRTVVPDLENIASEYLRLLKANIDRPNPLAEANYNWILLELYDQSVRNKSGGEMQQYLERPGIPNRAYVVGRAGHSARTLLAASDTGIAPRSPWQSTKRFLGAALGHLQCTTHSEAWAIGRFRLSGEVHMWMYDRFSLSRLLAANGFEDMKVKSPTDSDIPDWAKFELDVKDGLAFDPTSLFMEARKPA